MMNKSMCVNLEPNRLFCCKEIISLGTKADIICHIIIPSYHHRQQKKKKIIKLFIHCEDMIMKNIIKKYRTESMGSI